MGENPLIEAARDYIHQRLLQTKRKLDLVFASTKDQTKKQSLSNTIKDVERDIKKLSAGLFTEKDLERYSITVDELQTRKTETYRKKDIEEYKILRNIIVEPVNEYSTNKEVNAIWSYLQFFGREYLGLLSEQNLKLDYGHSFTRDKFYTVFNESVRVIDRYGELLQQITQAEAMGNKDYLERLLSLQGKRYRDIIIKTGKFLRDLEDFIQEILEAEHQGNNVLSEPNRTVVISGSHSTIDGISASEALKDLFNFIEEFIEFLKIPEIKHIEEEE